MKRFAAIATVVCMIISLSACTSFLGLGTFYETDGNRYGKWAGYLDVPSFLPECVQKDAVNSYSYTLYSYMDICYEIFLDITVEKNQFDDLLERVRAYSDHYEEQPAAYCEGYTEIVFMDHYDRWENSEQVGWADIEKVIYNADTGNIIYVVFHANDSNVYAVKDVAYFHRFSIDEENDS